MGEQPGVLFNSEASDRKLRNLGIDQKVTTRI